MSSNNPTIYYKTVKYFKSIRAYVYCEICKEVIYLEIDKEKIRNGLQTGLYIHKYKHRNEHADVEDPEDKSWEEHTLAVYIDSNYEVRGIKAYFGDSPLTDDVITAGTRIPVTVKDIPPMSVHLGMLSPDEYRILQLCDGNNTLEDVAKISGTSMEELENMMAKLKDKGLVKIIIRR
ncbi:MAG: hypothetical protein ACTSU2_15905 [Promethearchaeota archaeon]